MGLFSKLFSEEEKDYNKIIVNRESLESVIYYSKKAYPNEFLALFDGFIKSKTLYLTSLVFIPGETSATGAVFHSHMLPMSTSYWGTVHCHPGPSASPSDADLMTFSKHGVFHMIVCLPYSFETFKAYDRYGNPITYEIDDLSDMVDEEIMDFFDEDDIVRDDEVVKAGFFDEEDVILDDNPVDAYEDFEKRRMPQPNNIVIINGSNKIIFDSDGQPIVIHLNEKEKK